MNCNTFFFLVPSLSLINIQTGSGSFVPVQKHHDKHIWKKSVFLLSIQIYSFQMQPWHYSHTVNSQGIAGHILFKLVSAWLVFCPVFVFFFLAFCFRDLFLTAQGLRGVWQMAGKYSHQCTCTNPLLMVAYPSCIWPSCLVYQCHLVFSGLPGIQRTVTHPTGWTTPKVDRVERASCLVNLSTDVSLKIKCQVS